MSTLRGWSAPLALGFLVFMISFFEDLSWLVIAGFSVAFLIGYSDPWDAKGKRRDC